ncbi:MAG: ABC transporter permease subunit [Clostridiales bacterium]|nr:ABC transporter permease subunit [Clostridiales bacterium]
MKKIRIWAALFWVLIWQIGSMALGQEILLVSPVRVLVRLGQLVCEPAFWHSILFSSLRIGAGFFSAVFFGVLLAILSSRFQAVKELLAPAMLAIKTIPVASFIILALIWISSRNLAVFISFLMVLPVVYTNTLNGIEDIPEEIVEMAEVFAIPPGRRMRYLYVPQVMPYFRSGCEIALGLCWKSGIAAEVIGMPSGSIGAMLQQAKVYLDTPDLFAWTLVIVLISVTFEKLFLFLLQRGSRMLERM